MKNDGFRYTAAALAALLAFPAAAAAQDQEPCVTDGNRNTRSAEVEFSLAQSRDDTRSPQERYQGALDKLEPNWEMDETPPSSYLLAAHAYLGLRDLAGADSMLTTLVEVAPQCADQAGQMRYNAWVIQYNAGIQQMQGGDEQAALERFEAANMINPDGRSLAYAGSIHQRAGNNDKAAELYQMALEEGGQDEIVRTASINLAEIRRAAGDTEGALDIYETYSESNPDDVLGRLQFAIALMDADRQDEAQAIFSELMNRDDLTFNQWSQVGIGLYRAQNWDQAATAFSRAHELNPYNKETLENLANSYYQSEQYEDLLPLAQTLVERYPLERVPYNLLANSQREMGDSDAALANLETRDGMPVEVLRMQLTPVSETAYSIDGQVMNRTATAGSTLEVPITLVGEDGTEILTENLALTVPGEAETAAFSLQIETDTPVAGFRYEAPGS